MLSISTIVPIEAGTVVYVDREFVDIPVVIEVAGCCSARRLARQKISRKTGCHLFKFSAADVAIDFLALLVTLADIHVIDLRIDMAVRHENIRQSIVVEIVQAGSPAEMRQRGFS